MTKNDRKTAAPDGANNAQEVISSSHRPPGANMLLAEVEICGTRPLLQRTFGPEALPLQKTERSGVAGNDPGEWRRTMLVDANRQLFVLPTYVFGMVRDAAKHTRVGNSSLQSRVAATLQVTDAKILLDRFLPQDSDPTPDRTQPVYIDVSGVKNPATKARNVRYRLAVSAGWKASFTLLWDKTIVTRDQMRAILNDGGALVGLGDGRTIGYGRFTIERFSVLESPDATAQDAA
jgi:hypothetical protein